VDSRNCHSESIPAVFCHSRPVCPGQSHATVTFCYFFPAACWATVPRATVFQCSSALAC